MPSSSNGFTEHDWAVRNAPPPLSRRELLSRIGSGFGTLGLASVLADSGMLGGSSGRDLSVVQAAEASPLTPRTPHFAPRAKRVIQLFMPG